MRMLVAVALALAVAVPTAVAAPPSGDYLPGGGGPQSWGSGFPAWGEVSQSWDVGNARVTAYVCRTSGLAKCAQYIAYPASTLVSACQARGLSGAGVAAMIEQYADEAQRRFGSHGVVWQNYNAGGSFSPTCFFGSGDRRAM